MDSSDNRIRMVQLVTQMEIGGAQKAMLTVVQHLDKAQYDVRPAVLYTKNRLNPMTQELETPLIDFECKRIGAAPLMQFCLLIRGCWRLFRYLRKHRIHILQTYTLYANIIGVLIGRLARVPVIITSQRNSYHSLSRLMRLIDSIAAYFATKTIAVCESTRQFSIHQEWFRADKLVTIHNGLDMKSFDSIIPIRRSTDSILLVCAARLLHKKGIHVLLEALGKLSGELKWELWIVGDGPERASLEQITKSLQIERNVVFWGWKSEILPYLAAADVFVLPSLEEGFPNVLLEAMGLKKPVVATDVDGNAEAVEHGVTGYLVPAQNPTELARSIQALIIDNSLRERMGQAGYERVCTVFNLELMLKKYESVYREVSIARFPPVKVGLICSNGGHLLQLHLLRSWWSALPHFWVTFAKVDAISMLHDETVFWAAHPTNRNIPNLIRNTALAWQVLRRERPNLIISTGAGVAIPFIIVARLLGIKTIFIEEFNRITEPTLTGRILYPIADVFIIQWEQLHVYYPKAKYIGTIL